MRNLRFAIFGTGFWSQFQLAAWQELEGVECVALYNRTRTRAEALAERFGIPAVYGDPEALLDQEQVDFIDVITAVETHRRFVHLAAEREVAVVCQKPMGGTLEQAEEMVAVCREGGVPFFVHENFRWQRPFREVKRVLDTGVIGKPFRGRIHFCSSFPVFDNQPFLKDLEQFMLTDVGSHTLDVVRFLFGEAHSLYCQTQQIHPDIKGEDVATVMMQMGEGITVTVEMSYASRTSFERFPETFLLIEGDKGSLELGREYVVRVTTEDGTHSRQYPPPRYAWADPAYDIVHASIVPCNANLLQALQGKGEAETTGADNLKTVHLVFASYESAASDKVIHLPV